MEEVTADDIRLALIPLSNKSESLHNTVNMLLKCIFYSAERSQLLEYNPCEGISAKGGKPTQKKDSLTDQQVEVLLETVKGLPPYLFTIQNWEHFLRNMRSVIRNSVNLKNGLLPHYEMQGMF